MSNHHVHKCPLSCPIIIIMSNHYVHQCPSSYQIIIVVQKSPRWHCPIIIIMSNHHVHQCPILSFTFNCNGEEYATLTKNENTVDKVPYHEKYLNLSAGPRWNSLHSGAQEKGRGVNKGERSPSLLSLTLFRSSDN